ncbi:MAG: argininosuccinate lyase [Candidatus Aminicenantes bacterium]|jgi:argininosuccinate lyase
MKESVNKGVSPRPWEHVNLGAGSLNDPLTLRFVSSLSYDQRIYKQDIRGSLAHARMLSRVGLITPEDLNLIERGLRAIEKEIDQEGTHWPGWKIELEDVHMCIETALIERVGDAGRKLHTGRSRNDQVALDLLLWIEDAGAELKECLGKLFKAFIHLAEREGETLIPAYTHWQRAQPIVVGSELLAWVEAFERCRLRCQTLMAVNRKNPLGAGAIAGSSLPIDPGMTAEILSIGPPVTNSIDATSSRDAVLDFLYALSMIALTLSRWAEQWIVYCSTEFGFLKLDERYTTGSSMMPQKQNPDVLELIRGRCGNVFGNLVAMFTNLKGLSLGYNRDIQEDKRHLFSAFDFVSDCLHIAPAVVETAHFDAERIESTLDRGFLDATGLAEYLVLKGLPFRKAHQAVGMIVRYCRQKELTSLSQLTVTTFNQCCRAAGVKGNPCEEDVFQYLGAKNLVEHYQSPGNAGLKGFREQLKKWQSVMTGNVDSSID